MTEAEEITVKLICISRACDLQQSRQIRHPVIC
jgi:hypothetical protein